MSYNIFYLRMHFLMIQFSLLRCVYNSFRHRMRKMLFQTGCNSKQFIFVLSIKWDDPCYCRLCFGKGASLVKYDRIGISNCLQEFTTLHSDFVFSCLPDSGKYGNRHCQLQCTGEIHHQYGNSLGYISGQQISKYSTAKCIGNQSVCQMLSLALKTGLQFLSILDHSCNLLITAGTTNCFYSYNSLALFYNRTCVYGISFCFSHWNRFTSQRSLVYHSLAFCDHTVEWDHISHMYYNHVTSLDFFCINQYLCTFTAQPYLACIQGHGTGQIIHRFLVRPLLKQFSDSQKEHNRTGCGEIASENRNTDCSCVKNRNLNFTLPECLNPQPDIFHRHCSGIDCGQWIWQKQLTSVMENNFIYQFLLISLI